MSLDRTGSITVLTIFRRASTFCGIEGDEILKKFCSSLAQAAERTVDRFATRVPTVRLSQQRRGVFLVGGPGLCKARCSGVTSGKLSWFAI